MLTAIKALNYTTGYLQRDFFLKDHDAFNRFSAICTREKTFVTFFSAHPVPSE